MNTSKRYQSFTSFFCATLLTVFLLSEVIAQTANNNSSVQLTQSLSGQTLDEFSMTKALSNRLGQITNTNEQEGILVEPASDSGGLSTQNTFVTQETLQPIFSERTANRLDLSGQSPNDPSRKRIALGDFNNDGNEDLIVARWTENAQLFINVGGVLTLTNSAFSTLSDTSNARHAGVLDANGDGWQDLVLRNKILFNLGDDGNGGWLGFGTGQVIAGAELDPFTIQSADFDGDGDVDVATSPGRRMLVNNGNGILSSTPSRMESNILLNVIKFEARDFDGDGDIDLAGPEISEQRHFVYYNDGNGNFANALRLSLPLDTLSYTQVGADFNGDNIADFRIYADNQFPRAFMSTGAFNGDFPQYIRRNDGNLFGDNGKHGLVHIRDIDADGDLDFVLSSLELFIDRVDSLNEKTEIIVNKDVNSGTFEVFADPEYRDEESFDVKIMDINLDGNMDLFIAHQGRLAVYINAAAPKIIEITGQTNTPSETGVQTDYAITVTGASGNVNTTWDMGDGTTVNSGSDFFASHTYSAPGRYLVTVSVDNGVNIDSLVFWHTVFEPKANFRPNTSATIVYESLGGSGDRIWSVNPDHNTVSAVDLGTNSLISEINVGTNPSSLAFGGDGRLYVVNKDSGNISVIDTAALAVVEVFTQLPVASKPHGIVFSPVANSQEAFVTLEASGQLAKIDFSSSSLTTEVVGPFPRELSTNSDGSLVYVSRFITGQVPGEDTRVVSTAGGGEVWVVDAVSLLTNDVITLPFNNQPDAATSSRGVPNYLMAPITSPSGLNAFVPANVSNIYRGQFRDGQNREHNKLVRSMLAKLNLQTNQEETNSRHDFDNSAQPTAGVFDPTGNYLYLVFEASRKLRVYDVHAGEVLDNLDVGFAPRGVTVSPDGSRVVVDNYLSRSLHVFDASAFVNGDSVEHSLLDEVTKVGSEPLSPTLLLGKQLFFDAADERLSAQSYISCATCHADGGHDGRTWDFSDVGEGLRNTIDLRGRSGIGHGNVHWTANFNEIQDFENDIRDIFQGSGLMSDTDFANTAATLGAPKSGLSSDLDALATFIASLSSFGPSPYLLETGEKTPEAIAGQQVFVNAGCASCHSGGLFTDSPSGGVFHDIGTVDADTGGRLGAPLVDGGLDTPTLKGLWHGAPYLHDGSAVTVKDAVLAHTSAAVGFDVNTLNATELDNLEAYLLQLSDADFANMAPVIDNPGDQNGQLNVSVSLQLNANDVNSGDALTFSATGLPDGLSINSAGLISGTPALVSSFNVTASVSDGQGGNDSVDFLWNITAASNIAPNADAGVDQTEIDINSDGQESITLDGSLSNDSDGNIASYVWVSDTGIVIPEGINSSVDFPVGVHNVTLTVTDDDGASASDNVVIIISPAPNVDPIANAGVDQNTLDNDNSGSELVTLDASASNDNDGSIASYVWSSDTGVVIPSGVTSSAAFPVGAHNVTLIVTDDDGATANDTVLITVSSVPNSAPVIVDPGDQVSFLGANVSLVISASDPDVADVLTFGQSGLPNGLSINNTTGEINGSLTTAGNYNPTITVTDNNGVSSNLSFQWLVEEGSTVCTVYTSTDTPVNLPNQTASITSDLLVNNNNAITDVNVSVDMAHDWIGDLTMTLTHQDTNTNVVLLDQPGVPASQYGCREDDILITLDDDATANAETTCVVNPPALGGDFLPTVALSAFNQESANGTWTLKIDDDYVAADAGVLNSWSVEICTSGGAVNQEPTANADIDQNIVDIDDNGVETVALNGANSFDDDGNIVSYVWSTDTGVTIADGANTSADFPVGVHNVTLIVTDDGGATATDTVVITISPAPNTVPVANAGGDITVLDADNNGLELITLDASASSDSDGNIVSYVWSSDTGVTIPNGVSPSASFPVGAHTVTLTITDDEGASANDNVLIIVTAAPNVAPIANAGADQTIIDSDNNGAESVILDGFSSSDNDGSIVSYNWISDTGVVIPSGISTTASFPVGVHNVTLTVADDDGATATDNVTITVEEAVNNVPVIVDPGAQLSALGEVISLVIVANDPDVNDSLTFSQTGLPDGLDIDSISGEVTGTTTNAGVYNPTITVTDNNGGSSDLSFAWTVQDGVACTVYNSTDIPIVLPNQTASISSDLLVSNSGAISDVNVSVDMTHDWVGDLTMTLTHQATNTSVVLLDQPGVPASQYGCQEDDLLITLDDDATGNTETTCGATAPTLSGDFAPTSALSAFNQQAANGTWVLTIDDDYVAADAGVLNSWSVEICTSIGGVNQAPIAESGADQSVTDIDNSGSETINLNGSGSNDVDGSIVSYQWTSDTGVSIADGVTTSADFAVGEHVVTLTVTDNEGLTATDTMVVNVLTPSLQIVNETDVVSGVTDTWQVINLSNTYTSMVVLASVVLPDQSSIPAVTRVRNAFGNSFELRVQNPSGNAISGYDVHYFVVEEGVYNSAIHGVDMEAVRVDSTQTANRDAWTFEPRSYQNSYVNPVVIGQVMTANDPDWSVFWASATSVRTQAPTASGYSAGKNVGEDPNNVRANETLGIIVIESGSGLIASTEFVAAKSPDTIRGTGDSNIGYNLSYGTLSNPVTALVSATGMDGNNGGWPVLFGPTPLTNTVLNVSFDEDQVRDNERNHTTEEVGYIIFGTP